MENASSGLLVRHEESAERERSTCGWRHLLLSRQDRDRGLAAWAHAVDIDGAREHYHKVGTELYYVLDGEGSVMLDGVEHPGRTGSIVHIPPGVVHGYDNDSLEPVYFQVMLGRDKPDLMGYTDPSLLADRDAHLREPQ